MCGKLMETYWNTEEKARKAVLCLINTVKFSISMPKTAFVIKNCKVNKNVHKVYKRDEHFHIK